MISGGSDLFSHENEPVGGTHFQINVFAQRLVLIERQKAIRNRPTFLVLLIALVALGGKHLMRFQSKNSVYKFLGQNVDVANDTRHQTENTVEPSVATASLKRPPLLSDHLSSATSFPKYQKFSSQITIFETSCERPPLIRAKSVKFPSVFSLP